MDNLDYAVIGNCLSAALVSKAGTIEWLCLPDFNSQAVFAGILDPARGGHFAIRPQGSCSVMQEYIPETNIVSTTFSSGRHCFKVHDFMPRYATGASAHHSPPDIVRFIELVSGTPRFTVDYNPRLCYGRYPTHTEVDDHYIKSFTRKGMYESVYLYSDLSFDTILTKGIFTMRQSHFLYLSYNQKIIHPSLASVRLDLEKTKVYWQDWSARARKRPAYNNEIIRSALVLKLLSFQKTGAIIAAVTTSLPEAIGDVRNWDYRFCWIRDASMIIAIMTQLGHHQISRRFLDFILDIIPFKEGKIQIMYGIRGEKELTERKLDFLEGYQGSRPVRVGNAAFHQKQNDIYGVLVDVIHKGFFIFRFSADKSEHLWTVVRALLRHVEQTWRDTDHGIWEFRSQQRHFVFSKVLCWVAADRGSKIAAFVGQKKYAARWKSLAADIKADVMQKGWNSDVGAFTQYYGSRQLDAANLLMDTYGFIEPKDPHYVATVNKTCELLCVDDLMFRYKNRDDFGTPQNSFTICTFWMIKSLFRTGRKEKARAIFQKVLSYANHVGLFSEDIDIKTKRLLGNFPQGYSHLALIDTALTLAEGGLSENDRLHNRFSVAADGDTGIPAL